MAVNKVILIGNVGQNPEIKSTKDRKNIAKLPKKRSKLPDWKDLLGIAPDATGDLLSEEFVRNLRDEWQ